MRNDAINIEVNEGLLAFFAEEEGAVGGVVHEEVFGEDGRAGGVAEEVEVGFLVGVGIGKTLDQGTIGLSARCFTIHLSDWCVGFVA